MKIPIPQGFEVPPDVASDGTFHAVAEFKDNGDGTLTLISIDDSEVEDKDEATTETGEEAGPPGGGSSMPAQPPMRQMPQSPQMRAQAAGYQITKK